MVQQLLQYYLRQLLVGSAFALQREEKIDIPVNDFKDFYV